MEIVKEANDYVKKQINEAIVLINAANEQIINRLKIEIIVLNKELNEAKLELYSMPSLKSNLDAYREKMNESTFVINDLRLIIRRLKRSKKQKVLKMKRKNKWNLQ